MFVLALRISQAASQSRYTPMSHSAPQVLVAGNTVLAQNILLEKQDSLQGLEHVVTALRGALESHPRERSRYEDALQSWEGVPGYGPVLLQLSTMPSRELTSDGRLLAVLCLKNAVLRHWNARRAGEPAVPDADKALIRSGLLQALDEPEPKLSSQLLLLIGHVARFDGLPAWPELMPFLLQAASRPCVAQAARGLQAMYRVVKLQASRRMMLHRKQFFAMAAELLPRLEPMRMRYVRGLPEQLAQQSAVQAVEWLLKGGHEAAGRGVLNAGLALCKLDRQLLIGGWPDLKNAPGPCGILASHLEVLIEAQAQAQRLVAASGGDKRSHDAATALMPIMLLLAKLMLEVQDLHPLAMADCLPRALGFFHHQLVATDWRPGADDELAEKFLVGRVRAQRNGLWAVPRSLCMPPYLRCSTPLRKGTLSDGTAQHALDLGLLADVKGGPAGARVPPRANCLLWVAGASAALPCAADARTAALAARAC